MAIYFPADGDYQGAKRSENGKQVDLIAFFAPMWVLVPVLIWRDDRGPAFFRQTRVGRDGRTFRIWKFRTMRVNADTELNTLLSEQGTGDKPLFKVTGDPRITRIGHLLRRTSLDEFPQLFNVLEGSMSLGFRLLMFDSLISF